MWYTGVGSRETPEDIRQLIIRGARALADLGWGLRSGHAPGADTAFYRGHKSSDEEPFPLTQIFLPWPGFNAHVAQRDDGFYNAQQLPRYQEAQAIAQSVIPWWDNMGHSVKALHTRNVYQVLGLNLNVPSKALICWGLPDKTYVVKGGTGTAVRLAIRYNVPVRNLYYEEEQTRMWRVIARSQPSLAEQNPAFYIPMRSAA